MSQRFVVSIDHCVTLRLLMFDGKKIQIPKILTKFNKAPCVFLPPYSKWFGITEQGQQSGGALSSQLDLPFDLSTRQVQSLKALLDLAWSPLRCGASLPSELMALPWPCLGTRRMLSGTPSGGKHMIEISILERYAAVKRGLAMGINGQPPRKPWQKNGTNQWSTCEGTICIWRCNFGMTEPARDSNEQDW